MAILHEMNFACKTVSLGRIAFTYGTASQMSARLTFPSDGSLLVKLKLEPADINPHLRIRVALEQELKGPRWFRNFALALAATLPLLQTLQAIETGHLARQTLVVRPRSANWYHLIYKAPFVKCVFQIRARVKTQANKSIVRWHVEVAKEKVDASSWPEELKKMLKELWQEKGDGWFGIGNGIIANIDGVALALQRLDEVVRHFETTDDQQSSPKAVEEPKGLQAKMTGSSAAVSKAAKEPDVITLDD